ncbi:MAG: hypothetical protein K6T86_20485, partial [Pirellulales bacterium]|nr:hypothetical protein [Pirellulales bacterium]
MSLGRHSIADTGCLRLWFATRTLAATLWALLALVGLGARAAAQAAHQEVLRQIVARWEARQAKAKTAYWHAKGTGFVRRDWCSEVDRHELPEVTDIVPAEDVRYPVEL